MITSPGPTGPPSDPVASTGPPSFKDAGGSPGFRTVEAATRRMEPFDTHTGIAAPLARVNIDTDQIIPKQYLTSTGRDGLDAGLFHDWRYLDGDPSRPDPGFVLNLPRYRGATVLAAGDNFGCGSSREHAPWALTAYGFRCVISTSFADIFYNNSIKNGLLPAVVEPGDLERILDEIEAAPGLTVTADLAASSLTTSAGSRFEFAIPDHARHALATGLDDIEITLELADAIAAFEARSRERFPWLG